MISSVKGMACTIIENLPEQATMDDIMHALYMRAEFEHGEREISDGHGIAHDEAKQKLRKWVK
ncbi:MAG: hypothetical protein KBA28_01495 [Syntrophaceae bacterium]|jgi:hypothetical protein|nr:hypothetical protein [Syntrophaceae bacterium]